jgi:3',5'-cyclic AMP phosphodiesterase CpdA
MVTFILCFIKMSKRRTFLQQSLALSAFPLTGFASYEATKVKSFSLVHITDVHIKDNEIAKTSFAKALQKINATKNIDFIVNGGDSIMDALEATKEKTAEQWSLFRKIIKENNQLPLYHCIGNHDIWGWFLKEPPINDADYGKNYALKVLELQKPYYSFTHKKWKFIVLDSVQNNPKGGYIGLIDALQLEWLKNELETSKDFFVCIVSHIPILSICAALFFNKPESNGDHLLKRNLMHSDFFVLKDIFKNYKNIKCCMSGHIHLVDVVHYLDISYYCNGALSGNWWNGSFQEFAPSYAIMKFFNDGSVVRTMEFY